MAAEAGAAVGAAGIEADDVEAGAEAGADEQGGDLRRELKTGTAWPARIQEQGTDALLGVTGRQTDESDGDGGAGRPAVIEKHVDGGALEGPGFALAGAPDELRGSVGGRGQQSTYEGPGAG